MNEKHVAEKFNAPTTQCTIFWPVLIKDFVRVGFGASIGMFCPLRAYFARAGCKLVVSKSTASHWKGINFAPFWNEELPDTTFHARWTHQGGDCGEMWMRTHRVKCQMPRGFISEHKWHAFQRTSHYNGQYFRFWYDWSNLYLQSFGPRISAYRLPYNHSYAAFHVRKGDKLLEIKQHKRQTFAKIGKIENYLTILSQNMPHITDIFIATDDSDTVEHAAKAFRGRYNITWSADAARFPGGHPDTHGRPN
eukprot:CAMPEP_0172817946 /NCGR_PEP_ID=MMETSP1075-20121228/13585_1 /TAXON_ID=2916 /ORGANISM="Ceratium fusus, Strain PA161109" /LENGTH=249 /DNA_ID=CAMNT_0013658247 /DNA_START=20 /DNA_END=766 /DNA_ORIENTATION=-